MEAEGLTADETAADRQVPVEAVHEAVEYVRANRTFIEEERQREERLLRDRVILNHYR
jgi:hypothetical protein